MVFLEVMASGMAIITTKDTGCAEVVGDAAILVESRNPVSIKQALDKLISNPDFCKELGKAARRRLEENFTWATITKKYTNIYEEYSNST